jgi:hypothetical protein
LVQLLESESTYRKASAYAEKGKKKKKKEKVKLSLCFNEAPRHEDVLGVEV